MRAGLLSDPRVVHLLRTEFVPCMVAARNTAELLADPRDRAVLDGLAAATGEAFEGGERELFVLPDGSPQCVFLSLHGTDAHNGCTHMTARGRRSDDAVLPFRINAERALRKANGSLPEAWAAVWDGRAPELAGIAGETARWPLPAPGGQALRVHVRNSYRQYDDLHGCELVPLPDSATAGLAKRLAAAGDAAPLPRELFVALGRAMVPRGQVGTRLADASIRGELVLRAENIDGDAITGRIEGTFALAPEDAAEVGLRANAACLFRSTGRFCGRFRLERGALQELRAVAADVQLDWLPRLQLQDDFAPRHAVAFEFVATAAGR